MTPEDLQHRFQELARTAPQNVSSAAEDQLRVAFRARLNPKPRLHNPAGRVAALGLIAVGLYVIWTNVRHGQGSGHQTPAIAQERQMPDFIALPYAQSEVPLEQPVIVRVQIPVSELSAMGVRSASASAGVSVNADFLIGQDGIARAVRLVQ